MKRYMVNFQESENLMVDMAALLAKKTKQKFCQDAVLNASTVILAGLDGNALAIIKELAIKEKESDKNVL